MMVGRQLFTDLPVGRCPDVLGMGRERPGQAAQDRGIAGDRGRRVQEMRVKARDADHAHLMRQHAGLPPAAHDGWRCRSRSRSARISAAAAASKPGIAVRGPHGRISRPGADHRGGIPAGSRRALAACRAAGASWGRRRVAQGPDVEAPTPAVLQRHQFLRDEGFGQAWPALEDKWRNGGACSFPLAAISARRARAITTVSARPAARRPRPARALG